MDKTYYCLICKSKNCIVDRHDFSRIEITDLDREYLKMHQRIQRQRKELSRLNNKIAFQSKEIYLLKSLVNSRIK